MDVKDILRSHKQIDDRINLELEELARLRALSGLRAVRYTEVSHAKGTHSDKVADCAVKIAQLENRIDSDIDRLVDLKEKIMDIVQSLDDDTERVVIERYYILHETWDTISEKLCYSRRHITRLHKSAIDHLTEIYSDTELIA